MNDEIWSEFLDRALEASKEFDRPFSKWVVFGHQGSLKLYLRVGPGFFRFNRKSPVIVVANVYSNPYREGVWKQFMESLETFAIEKSVPRIKLENVHNTDLHLGLIKNGYEMYDQVNHHFIKMLPTKQ